MISTFINAFTIYYPPHNRHYTLSKKSSAKEKINIQNKRDNPHINEKHARLRVQSIPQNEPSGSKNQIESSLWNRNCNFLFTNPSVINALDQEALRDEENVWWTETTPYLELQEYSEVHKDNSKANTEEQKQIENMKKVLENKSWQILQNLIGEEGIQNISHLVKLRSDARQQRNFDLADDIKKQIQDLSFDPKHSVSIQSNEILASQDQHVEIDKIQKNNPLYEYRIELKDLPAREGGGSKWRFFRVPYSSNDEHMTNKGSHADIYNNLGSDDVTVLQLAHIALGMAAYANENNTKQDAVGLQELVKKVEVSSNPLYQSVNIE